MSPADAVPIGGTAAILLTALVLGISELCNRRWEASLTRTHPYNPPPHDDFGRKIVPELIRAIDRDEIRWSIRRKKEVSYASYGLGPDYYAFVMEYCITGGWSGTDITINQLDRVVTIGSSKIPFIKDRDLPIIQAVLRQRERAAAEERKKEAERLKNTIDSIAR